MRAYVWMFVLAKLSGLGALICLVTRHPTAGILFLGADLALITALVVLTVREMMSTGSADPLIKRVPEIR